MEARERLWQPLAEFFETDDGSLPEVWLAGLSAPRAARIFDDLRRLALPLLPDQTVWWDEREEEVPLAEVPDPGALAAAGEIHLHVVFRGVRSRGITLPDLGVFVVPGVVQLYCRMGEDWSPDVLAAFVELLDELGSFRSDVQFQFVADGGLVDPPDVQQRARAAIDAYLGVPG